MIHGNKKRGGKNGSIELMRFIFAVIIVCFHADLLIYDKKMAFGDIGPLKLTFFEHGYIGVEFFFLVSGYLMARSIYKSLYESSPESKNLGEETASFIWKKIKALYPFYFISCLVVMIIMICAKTKWIEIFDALPSFVFLQRSGAFDASFNGPGWYIGSMLLGMAILYPICRRYYKMFVLVIAPVITFFLVGFLIHNTGNLATQMEWVGFTYKGNLRAIAELCLGATCFEIGRRVEGYDYKMIHRVLLTLVAIVGYVAAILFAFDGKGNYTGYLLLLLAVSVTITFARLGVISHSGILDNKVIFYLGALSLPIYIFQDVFLKFVEYILMPGKILPRSQQAVIVVLGSVILAIVAYAISKLIRNRKSNKKAEMSV